MKEKNKSNKRENKTQKAKKESAIVTKESICATGALFCFLVFLILCTRSLIFGGFGLDVHVLLTGVFGYMAYPLFFGTTYLFIMGLIGKSLVRNKKAAWLIALALISVAFVTHTALSFARFDEDGYLSYCFNAGETFPNTTVTGWLGGVLLFALAKLVSQVGVLVIFSLFSVLFAYLACVVIKKGAVKKEIETKQKDTEDSSMDIPLSNTQNFAPQSEVAPTNDERKGERITQEYQTPSVAQRPGVRLYENSAQEEQRNATDDGFSPFGRSRVSQETQPPIDNIADSYERSRAFLFGGTPAENYKKNLLFDPNANVNKRPPVEPVTPKNTYVPSYASAYEDSVNENSQPIRPVKVVCDNTQNVGYGAPDYPVYGENSYTPPVRSVEEKQPVEENQSYSVFEERDATHRPFASYEPNSASLTSESTNSVTDEPTVKGEDENAYRRHEYMDLFSTANPNVFGREENIDNITQRNAFKETDDVFGRESEGRGRDSLHLFDDEEDQTPTRGYQTNFTANEANTRGEFSATRGVFERNEENSSDLRDGLFSERNAREANFESSFNGLDAEIPVQSAQPMRAERFESVAEPVPTPKKPRVIRPYIRIPLDDLDCRDIEPTSNSMEVEETKQNIISTLEDFKVTGASIASVTFGPTVTRYNVTIPRSISPKKVVALDQSIAISLHSSGVNVYPNYEDGVVSIEVPNKQRQFVQLGCMLSGNTFVNAKSSSLMFAMGKDVANKKVYGDISKMIHLLVAGSSGSGKSVFLGSLIISLIYKYSPEELRLILIDPKKTEFVLYNNLPHLMINEIITDVGKAVQSLNWAIGEMNRRYSLFEQMSKAGTYVVNLDQYNEQVDKKDRVPKIVIIIDELADLMLAAKKEMEDRIQNLTQKARAAGIHLIVATQRPSTDVITGVIKSNLPTRVAFYVASDVDSRVILDQSGAQKLLGKGDFLYTMPGLAAPARVQSAFISPEESQKVVNFIKNNNEAYYDEEATAFINSRSSSGGGDIGGASNEKELDPMNIEALRHVILSGSASISMIQRKCSAGYNRAGKIVEWMEDMGYISPFDGAKARKVLITKEEFEAKYGPL